MGGDAKAEGTSGITWEIEPVGDSCHLTVTHDKLRKGATTNSWGLVHGPVRRQALAGTGELLTTPGSLMYT